MQGMPEYVINVEQRQNELGQMMLAIKAQQLVQSTLVAGALVYKTMVEQVVSPFMQMTTAMVAATAKLYEVLQKVQASVSADKTPPKTVQTQLSRGFCLSIPELGELLISHEGDVVFSGSSPINKSVKITAPRQVVLDGVNTKEMELEAAAAFITKNHSGKIDTLHFKANRNADDTIDNALVIKNEAELEIGELTLEDALLVNSRRLSVTRSMDLQGGMFLNAGKFETTAKTATLKDIAYFHNAQNANFNATGQVILHTGNFSNNGNITAQDLNLVSSELVNNTGTIKTQRKLEISGLGSILNTGTINGTSGNVYVYGTRFEQKGYFFASEVNLFADESLLIKKHKGTNCTF